MHEGAMASCAFVHVRAEAGEASRHATWSLSACIAVERMKFNSSGADATDKCKGDRGYDYPVRNFQQRDREVARNTLKGQ